MSHPGAHFDAGTAVTAGLMSGLVSLLHDPTVRGAVISVVVAFASGFAAKAGAHVYKRLTRSP